MREGRDWRGVWGGGWGGLLGGGGGWEMRKDGRDGKEEKKQYMAKEREKVRKEGNEL